MIRRFDENKVEEDLLIQDYELFGNYVRDCNKYCKFLTEQDIEDIQEIIFDLLAYCKKKDKVGYDKVEEYAYKILRKFCIDFRERTGFDGNIFTAEDEDGLFIFTKSLMAYISYVIFESDRDYYENKLLAKLKDWSKHIYKRVDWLKDGGFYKIPSFSFMESKRLKVYNRILEDTDLRKVIDDFSKDFLRDIDTDDDDLMYESFGHNRSRMKEGISLEGILGLDNWEKDWNGEIGGEFASTDACRCLMGIICEKSADDVLFYIKLKNSFIKNILLLLKEKIQKAVIKGAQGLEDLIDGNTDKESSQKSIDNMMSFGKVLLIYTIFKKMWKNNEKSTENYINNIITHFGYDEEFLLNKYTKKMNLLTAAVYGL